MDGQDDASGHALASGAPSSRRPLVASGAALAAIALAIVLVVVTRPTTGGGAAAATTSPPTPAPATTASPSLPPMPTPAATVDADPAALAELQRVAATLPTRITLTSPAAWDQWLPAGKPYPGKDTADDMSTCPRLSDRLGAALGRKMSYWVGTLPEGPYGCQWATVPLYSGPNAPNYPYLASVGFQDDGTTTEQLSQHFYHHQGRLCPSVAVPSVGEGAYLVRCEDLDGISYALVLPDTRTSGVWTLTASARSDAGRPPTDVLRPVIEGSVAAFG
jgi:hypothetical protein